MTVIEPDERSVVPGGRCNVCLQSVSTWELVGGDVTRARCPSCQALERHRHLAFWLERLRPVPRLGGVVLEYGPHRAVQPILDRLEGIHQIGFDLSSTARKVDLVADACDLPFDDASVDLAICFHLLEHIPDDASAITELSRVLRPEGVAVIQVPWNRDAPTDEDPGATPADRIRRFGHREHVRMYGHDIEERLSESGLNVVRLEAHEHLSEAEMRELAVPANNPIWLCRPNRTDRLRAESVGVQQRLARRNRERALKTQALRQSIEDLKQQNREEVERLRSEVERLKSEVERLKSRRSVRIANWMGRQRSRVTQLVQRSG